jgi:hypothetical protein
LLLFVSSKQRQQKHSNPKPFSPSSAYSVAVVTSCSLAIGLNRLVAKFNTRSMSPTTAGLIRGIVPFSAVVGAGILNLAITRQQELTEGIVVFDE